MRMAQELRRREAKPRSSAAPARGWGALSPRVKVGAAERVPFVASAEPAAPPGVQVATARPPVAQAVAARAARARRDLPPQLARARRRCACRDSCAAESAKIR